MSSPVLFKSWLKVFLHPWTPIFREELDRKSNVRTLANVTIAALLGLGLSWLTHLLTGQSAKEYMGITSIWVDPGTQSPFSSWSVIALAGVIIGFYDFEIVLFIFARLLGGRGPFGTQAYAQSLFYAPLAIVQQVFAVMPVIGRPLFFLFAVYSLLPTTSSLRAAHDYSTWRAIITWLMPILLNVLVVFVIVKILTANVGH